MNHRHACSFLKGFLVRILQILAGVVLTVVAPYLAVAGELEAYLAEVIALPELERKRTELSQKKKGLQHQQRQ